MHVHVHSGKKMTTDPKIQVVARGQDTCQPYRYYLFYLEFSKNGTNFHRKSGGSAHSFSRHLGETVTVKHPQEVSFFFSASGFFSSCLQNIKLPFLNHVNKNLFH